MRPFLVGKIMKENLKIKTMQKIIDGLQEQITQLVSENKELKSELVTKENESARLKELEKEMQKVIKSCNIQKEAYEKAKKKYNEEFLKLKEIRVQYNREMNKIVKSVKEDFD